MNKNWIYVILSGFIEILWVIGLKSSDHWLEWTGTALLLILSFFLLMEATKKIPVTTAYAIFTGIGTAGTVIFGTVVYGDPLSWKKVFFLVMLVVGIMGLKLITNEEQEAA